MRGVIEGVRADDNVEGSNGGDGEQVVGPKHSLDAHFLCSERFYQRRVREAIYLLMNAIHQNILPAQANATASALFRRVPSTPVLITSSWELPLEWTLKAHWLSDTSPVITISRSVPANASEHKMLGKQQPA